MDFTKRYKSHHDSTRVYKDKYVSLVNKDDYLNSLLNSKATLPRTMYVHVPYCKKICSFCNMNTGRINNTIADYHLSIIEQIKDVSKYLYIQSKPFESIYFGGGTPTTLSAKQLNLILKAMHEYLPISKSAEISLETSITDLTDDKLQVLKDNKVNRFSIGVQSFVDRARKLFFRVGTGEYAAKRIKEIIDMGFTNTNIDLIYNYPNQTLFELRQDLDIIKSLNIAGLSMYSLILNNGSYLHQQIENKAVNNVPHLNVEKILFSTIYNELIKSKYQVLEITKMVKANRDLYQYIRIKNTGGDCLALGKGAGGKLENYLYYHRALSNKAISLMGRVVNKGYNTVDYIVGALQFTKVNYQDVLLKTGFNFKDKCLEFINLLRDEQLADCNDNELKLTEKGIFWGNNICRDLIYNLVEVVEENDY